MLHLYLCYQHKLQTAKLKLNLYMSAETVTQNAALAETGAQERRQ